MLRNDYKRLRNENPLLLSDDMIYWAGRWLLAEVYIINSEGKNK